MEAPFVHPSGESKCHMIMARGTFVNFNDIESTNIDLEEIKIHITNLNRYCGAIPVKLIHHSYIVGLIVRTLLSKFTKVSDIVTLQEAYGYTHDFSEAYLGDIVTGLKYRPFFNEYRQLEDRFEAHIHNKLGLPLEYRLDNLIKTADNHALVYEMTIHRHPSAEENRRHFGITINRNLRNQIADVFHEPPCVLWGKMVSTIAQAQIIIEENYGKKER